MAKSKNYKKNKIKVAPLPVKSPPIPPRSRTKEPNRNTPIAKKSDTHKHQSTLHDPILKRPSESHVRAKTAGLDPNKICKSLHPRVAKLERKLSANLINEHLLTRPSPSEVERMSMMNPSHCRNIQNVGYKLQRKLNSHAINEFLEGKIHKFSFLFSFIFLTLLLSVRVEAGSANARQLSKIAPALAPTSVTLSRRMCQDTVKSLLENRPTVEQLQDYGLFPKTNKHLHGRVKAVERSMAKSQLEFLLTDRAEFSELEKRGVAKKTHVDASLQNSHHLVEKQLRRRSIDIHLQERPSFDQVKGLSNWANWISDEESSEGVQEQEQEQEQEEEESSDYESDYEEDDLYYEKAIEEDYEDDYGDDEVISGGLGRWSNDEDEDEDEDDDDDDDEDDEEEDDKGDESTTDLLPEELDERMIFAIALRAAHQLEQGGFINHIHKANLKERILDGDNAVIGTVWEFVETSDASRLMQKFQLIAKE